MSLFRYPGSKVYWYDFKFAGQRIRESTKSNSKNIAAAAERNRRRQLEESYNGVQHRNPPKLFTVAAEEWLAMKKLTLAPRSHLIEKTNLTHLKPTFDRTLVPDIQASDVSRYQQKRLAEKASPKTVNLEIGTLRAILRRNKVWSNIQQDVRMLPTRDDVGKALTLDQEKTLLMACRESRSRSLPVIVTLALSTCMRYSEIRLLKWRQIDLDKRLLTVGKSKTEYGTGRGIPLNERALVALTNWAANFPERDPDHYLFPCEKYGAAGDDFVPKTYNTDPTKPIGNWKEAWEKAKKRARVECRFHDLRHTGCTRLLEGGVPYPVVASIMGWSAATTIRMAKRYGHIGHTIQRQAIELLNGTPAQSEQTVGEQPEPLTPQPPQRWSETHRIRRASHSRLRQISR